jgi:hypothetical protein
MMNNPINTIYSQATQAISQIVTTYLTCFQIPLREDIKPIFPRQIEALIFHSIESQFYHSFNLFFKFLNSLKHILMSTVNTPSNKTEFDKLIILSKQFIPYWKLLVNILKITNMWLQTFSQNEITAHTRFKSQIASTSTSSVAYSVILVKHLQTMTQIYSNRFFHIFQINTPKYKQSLSY